MSVVLARVDDRLVHGQVVEGWVPYLSVNVIIIASDEICLDQSRCRLLKLIVPDHVHLMVVPFRELRKLVREMDSLKMLLLFKDLDEVLVALEMGLDLDRINLGNLHHVRGGVEVTPSVYLNRKDIQTVRDLMRKGVNMEAREVPDSKSFNLLDFVVKAEGLM